MKKTSDFEGKWALVTGASSGIGAEMARELARRGAKLILTGRRRGRLEALAAELGAQGSETRILAEDLNDPEAPGRIFAATADAGIAVDILINNAGLGRYGEFRSNPIEQELSQVRVNCEAMVHMARLFLPAMVERRRGWMLITASTASFQPVPYLATYAATKVFDRFFAQAIAEEVARFGVKVTALCPGPTESEFFEIANAHTFKRKVQPTAEVARKAIDALERGRRTILPKRDGRFTAFAVRFLPVEWITWYVDRKGRPKG
jgi:hypothetical protein